jgi:hypothetical protein
LHQTKEDIPKNGIIIDATRPLEHVVDEILSKCREADQGVIRQREKAANKAEPPGAA